MTKLCLVCGKGYASKRADSKTCSSRCKKSLQRGQIKGDTAKGDNQVLREAAKLTAKKMHDDEMDGIRTLDEKSGVYERDYEITAHVAPGGGSMPLHYGDEDCTCQHCEMKRINGSKNVINHGAYKNYTELGDGEVNRVSLPGDSDYVGGGAWT